MPLNIILPKKYKLNIELPSKSTEKESSPEKKEMVKPKNYKFLVKSKNSKKSA